MKLYTIRTGIIFLLFFLSFNTQAELYKWVDKNGKVHFSDKKPEDEIKKEIIPIKKNKDTRSQQTSNSRVIIRPYEKTSRKLHLLDTVYSWKKESHSEKTTKLGIYNTGKGCTSRGAIKTPDVFIHHKNFLPKESSLANRISKVINSLDYESSRTKKYDLLKQLKRSGGLSLHSEIIDMNIVTCAPNIYKDQRLLAAEKISAGRFIKNKVSLNVHWKLKTSRDQVVLYETTTEGFYNGWHKNGSPSDAIGSALEAAALGLFSDKRFINKILVEEDQIDLNIETSEHKPIAANVAKKYRALFLDLNENAWKDRAGTSKEIGNLLFGDKCTASKPLTLIDAINKQEQLFSDRRRTHNAILNRIRPLGYSINLAPDDLLSTLNVSNGYSLKAEIVDFSYEACAPSLSASTKYKTIDNISTRKLTRKRIKLSIKWSLKSDANRTTLYQSKTSGIAGSLLTDSDDSKVMQGAIIKAAEQLFAEQRFIDLLEIKTAKMERVVEPFKMVNKPSNPIVRPSQGEVKNLFLVTNDTPWSLIAVDSSIGVYAYGDECIPYRKKRWPKALNKYSRMFPSKGEIANTQAKVLKSLDYKYQISDQYNVINMKRKVGGYSLHGEIINLRYDSCAPGADENDLRKDNSISHRSYKRHRANIDINWELIAEDNKKIIYQTSTSGVSDSWLINAKGEKIVMLAIEDATKQLFSSQDFINKIIEQKEKLDKGFMHKLFSFLQSDSENDNSGNSSNILKANNYVLKAHAAQVFVDVSGIKMNMTQFYLMEGRWPDSLDELGISENSFQNSKAISYVNIQSDGSIIAELKEIFGKDKMIKFTPDSLDDNASQTNRWMCSSNLQQDSLPTSCDSM